MKFITMIPTKLNDGSTVSAEVIDEFIDFICLKFGGVTIDSVGGFWMDETDEQVYHDNNLRLTVVCDSGLLDLARQLVIEIGRRLDQKAMYFEVVNDDGVEFLRIQD